MERNIIYHYHQFSQIRNMSCILVLKMTSILVLPLLPLQQLFEDGHIFYLDMIARKQPNVVTKDDKRYTVSCVFSDIHHYGNVIGTASEVLM